MKTISENSFKITMKMTIAWLNTQLKIDFFITVSDIVSAKLIFLAQRGNFIISGNDESNFAIWILQFSVINFCMKLTKISFPFYKRNIHNVRTYKWHIILCKTQIVYLLNSNLFFTKLRNLIYVRRNTCNTTRSNNKLLSLNSIRYAKYLLPINFQLLKHHLETLHQY